jgi:Peptidase family M23
MRRALLAAVAAALHFAPVAGAWTWPADGPVLQPFAFDPAHPYAAGQHRGIDIGAAAEAPVVAPAAGTVTFAGTVPTSGKSVTITTADGYAVTLTHLGSIAVADGVRVAEGDVVGGIGASGEPELQQPYVHLGIRSADQPQGYLDPLSLLPPRSAAPAPAPAPARRARRPARPCPCRCDGRAVAVAGAGARRCRAGSARHGAARRRGACRAAAHRFRRGVHGRQRLATVRPRRPAAACGRPRAPSGTARGADASSSTRDDRASSRPAPDPCAQSDPSGSSAGGCGSAAAGEAGDSRSRITRPA